jgi:hypothetical protein
MASPTLCHHSQKNVSHMKKLSLTLLMTAIVFGAMAQNTASQKRPTDISFQFWQTQAATPFGNHVKTSVFGGEVEHSFGFLKLSCGALFYEIPYDEERTVYDAWIWPSYGVFDFDIDIDKEVHHYVGKSSKLFMYAGVKNDWLPKTSKWDIGHGLRIGTGVSKANRIEHYIFYDDIGEPGVVRTKLVDSTSKSLNVQLVLLDMKYRMGAFVAGLESSVGKHLYMGASVGYTF